RACHHRPRCRRRPTPIARGPTDWVEPTDRVEPTEWVEKVPCSEVGTCGHPYIGSANTGERAKLLRLRCARTFSIDDARSLPPEWPRRPQPGPPARRDG